MPKMNGLDLAHLVKEQSPSCHIIFFDRLWWLWVCEESHQVRCRWLFAEAFFKRWYWRDVSKVKRKTRSRAKKAQVEDLVSHGYSTDLEEAIHARLADSQLTLKDLAYQLGFSSSYLSVLIKKKLGLPFKTTSFRSEWRRLNSCFSRQI